MTTALENLYSLPNFEDFGASGFQLQLAGQPLGAVLNTLVATIKEQSTALQELQNYTYADLANRVAIVESRVQRLEQDVEVERRPLGYTGQQATLIQLLEDVNQRTAFLEAHRKYEKATELEKLNGKRLLSSTFSQWHKQHRVKVAVGSLAGKNASSILRSYFKRWMNTHHWQKTQNQRAIRCRALLFQSQKTVQRRFLHQWNAFIVNLAENRDSRTKIMLEAAVRMEKVSHRAHARETFLAWQRLVRYRHRDEEQLQLTLDMERISARALVSRYFEKWAVAEEANSEYRRTLTIVHALSLRAYDNLGRKTLNKLARFAQRKKQRRSAVVLIPRFSRLAVTTTAVRYFSAWTRFVQKRQRQRERLEIDDMFVELSRRCDNLATQMDVGLTTIANTNSVVSQVVEKVLVLEGTSAVSAASPNVGGGGVASPHRASVPGR